MANRTWRDVWGLDTWEIVRAGSFLPAGTGAPTLPSITSTGQLTQYMDGQRGWSVTRLAAGRYVLLFSNPLALLKCVRVSLQTSAASQLKLTVGPISYSARTIEIDCISAATGALTDIAANASNAVHWILHSSIDNSQNQAFVAG